MTIQQAAGGSRAPRRTGRLARRNSLVGLGLLSPALAILLIVTALPMAFGVYQSLTDMALTRPGQPNFVGFENYEKRVLTGSFGQAAITTATIMVLSLLVQLPIGYALALNLTRTVKASTVFRTIFTIPMMLTPVAVGLMWRFLSEPDLGIIRWAVSLVDASAHPNLLGSHWTALALIVAVSSWSHIPFVTLLLLAGLLGVPDELYEAAACDGANRWQRRLHVTLPGIAPVLLVVCILRLAGDYKMFDLVYTVTNGGPGTSTRNLSMLAYTEGLTHFNVGRACAIGMAMAILALPAFFAYRRMARS
jgi:multiple sugar transport system permease protein